MSDPGNMGGYVYFILCRHTDTVKIGFTRSNPLARLANLQTGNPHKLELFLVVDGDVDWEKAFHKRCAADRLEGEWFHFSQEVQDTIRAIRWFYQQVDGPDGSVRWRS